MKSPSLNAVVSVFVAVAVLLQATQRAAAFSALPVACIAEARALCRESPGVLQVRRCLAKQDGVSVACKSALDARGNLRKSMKRLLNEARKHGDQNQVHSVCCSYTCLTLYLYMYPAMLLRVMVSCGCPPASWDNGLVITGGSKSGNVNWSIVDPIAPIVEADMTAGPQSWCVYQHHHCQSYFLVLLYTACQLA